MLSPTCLDESAVRSPHREATSETASGWVFFWRREGRVLGSPAAFRCLGPGARPNAIGLHCLGLLVGPREVHRCAVRTVVGRLREAPAPPVDRVLVTSNFAGPPTWSGPGDLGPQRCLAFLNLPGPGCGADERIRFLFVWGPR